MIDKNTSDFATLCPWLQQSQKKQLLSKKVIVKVTKSFTLVSFKRASLVEYVMPNTKILSHMVQKL